ncbi:Glycosyl hydrolase, BNR repeat precursor [Minicystis rosea]|nr:Glycosyl hydrolase, BNR repeat precursor [Minicystis rosea]
MLAATLTFSAGAAANGRYPAAGQIALDPANPGTIMVRATYGILFTKNAGQRWEWVCESAVGFSGSEDPMMSFMADGTILAGIFEGLSVSRDHGCGWSFVGGGIDKRYVVDLAVDKVDATKGVLVVSNSTGQDDAGQPVFLGQLWQTADNGKTWTQAGTDLPKQFLALTVETGPSDRNRVYVSGRMGPPNYAGVLHRSDDRGATWQEKPIPGSDDTHLPYVGAIDPNNPDIVYVRLDGAPQDQLVVTKDGGQTWTKVFESTGDLFGFALSPDGATVAVGGDKDGVWTAPTSTLAFTKVSSVGAKCLTWTADGLYACADEFIDGFTAGISKDQGKTFTPLMHLGGLCGPLTCDPSSNVAQHCVSQWPVTAANISAVSCDAPDGGASGSATSGSSGGGASSSSGAGGGDSGCATAAPATGAASMAASGAALVGLLAAMRRRRRR